MTTGRFSPLDVDQYQSWIEKKVSDQGQFPIIGIIFSAKEGQFIDTGHGQPEGSIFEIDQMIQLLYQILQAAFIER